MGAIFHRTTLPTSYLLIFSSFLAYWVSGKRAPGLYRCDIKGSSLGSSTANSGLVYSPQVWTHGKMSGSPTDDQEADAKEIAALMTEGVAAATPYFQWRAEHTTSVNQLNVLNKSSSLFERYKLFRDRFRALSAEADSRKEERQITKQVF